MAKTVFSTEEFCYEKASFNSNYDGVNMWFVRC